MLDVKITECPHCGSDDGYHYILVLKGVQYQTFGNETHGLWTQFVDTLDGRHGASRCNECEEIIKDPSIRG